MVRRPRGYIGDGHETVGSDILAVLRTVSVPEQILGIEQTRKLSQVDPLGWYPIEWLLELMERLDQELGHDGLIRMGRALFKISHAQRVLGVAHSAADIIHGIDGMYHFANRGQSIGGWSVRCFEPGYAELDKTTPHHCAMEQGLLAAALAAVGCPSRVSQEQCFRKGAESCVFSIRSGITDRRWGGG